MRLPVIFVRRQRIEAAGPVHAGPPPGPRIDSASGPPAGALLPVARQRRAHPLNDRVWRLCITAVASGVIAFVVMTLLGGRLLVPVWLIALALLISWGAAARMLLLDARWPRFWTITLVVTAATIVLAGRHRAGAVIATTFASAFLVFRRYRPLRHLTSVRRAKLFGLGAIATILAFATHTQAKDPSWFTAVGQHAARFALVALRIFWIQALIQIFLGMRLHFMRLRPKLATAGLFVAAVPLVLLLTLGLVAFYSVLGANLASRGRATILDWVTLLERQESVGPLLFGAGFVYPAPGSKGTADQTLAAPQPPPDWVERLNEAVAQRAAAGATDSASLPDTTALFEIDSQAWVLRLERGGTPTARIVGYRIEPAPMDRLARLLQRDTALVGGTVVHSGARRGGGEGVQITVNDTTGAHIMVKGSARPDRSAPDSSAVAGGTGALAGGLLAAPSGADSTGIPVQPLRAAADVATSFWHRDLYFGAASVPAYRLAGSRLVPDDILLTLKTRPGDLWQEMAKGENELNRAILFLLAVLASIFLFLELVALYFGIRITTGITGAVQALHNGTLRLARGDLETQIDVPNEDEFGDLADSFNEMTAAVRRGRVEAVARELLEREIGTARKIQERLLPAGMPKLPGYEIAASSVPSRRVGGDYYDFVTLADGALGVAIGDVSGKGIPAAMLMSNLQACLQGQVIHPSSVAEVVRRVNNLLVNSTDAEMFATFFYAALDPQSGGMTSCNAGHDPPVILRTDGSMVRLSAGGLLLGMFPGVPYDEERSMLAPGDVLVMYTDGIPEAIGPPLPVIAAEASDRTAARLPGGRAGARRDRGGAGDSAAPATGARAAVSTATDESAVDSPSDTAGADEGEESESGEPDPHANFFEEGRLMDVLRAHRHGSAEQIKAAILESVARHTAGIDQSDDITLVVIRRLPQR